MLSTPTEFSTTALEHRCELWGKLGRDGSGWYPLEAHLADTAASALALWDFWFAPNLRQLFSELLGEQPRERFAFIAAAHDIGKANPLFQTQTERVDDVPEILDHHQQELKTRGYAIPSLLAVGQVRSSNAGPRHEVFTRFLMDGAGYPEWVGAALGGHHGQYPVADGDIGSKANGKAHQALCAGQWSLHSREILNELRDALGLHGDIPRLATNLVPAVVAVTGAVALADWLASDENAVESGREIWDKTKPLAGYLSSQFRWFSQHLQGTLGRSSTPDGSFADLFGFASPNGTQQAVINAGDSPLVIVMSPMGEGKTEAALARHQTLDRGLFFGLPTMATADAMFNRVRRFYSGSDRQAGSLSHSRGFLNSYYELGEISPLGSAGSDDQGLGPAAWFRGRHRGLLAPVTVGTCDQALAASLPHKWVAMRLLGLANKHVVLDEVHSYDPYQDELLCTLLRWFGVCDTPVTLLSATLPRVRVDRYLEAWGAGHYRFDGTIVRVDGLEYPAVISANVGPGARTSVASAPIMNVRNRSIAIHSVSTPSERGASASELARIALVDWSPGLSTAVIANTVTACIKSAQEIAETGAQTLVVHSRMTARMRRTVEQEVTSRFGRGGPGGGIVIATQILESSLDVDFDRMVTELAPAPSLLQRSGRIWRHSTFEGRAWVHPELREANRPVVPCLTVIHPEGQIKRGSALPYTVAELERTRTNLLGRENWVIPDDLQALVDSCVIQWSDLLDGGLGIEEHLAGEAMVSLAARNKRIDWNALADELGRLPGVTTPDSIDESMATRLGLNSATIIAVGTHGCPAAILEPAAGRVDLHQILDHSLPVNGALIDKVARGPGSWDLSELHPMLGGIRAVDLDAHPTHILDPKFGLIPREPKL
jgi:CRISPR-associated endonuclease/helicase Cas3